MRPRRCFNTGRRLRTIEHHDTGSQRTRYLRDPACPAPAQAGTPSGRLDALRGAAVLLVMGAHFHMGKIRCPRMGRCGAQKVASFGLERSGPVLRALGISDLGLLFQEYSAHGRVRVGRFLFRRGLKIYPSFWVMLLYTVAAALATGHAVSLATLGSELLFVQNYGPTMYNFTWTLAVEQHFYLLLAALVAWRVHQDGHPHRVFPIVLAALPVVLLLRCYWAWLGNHRR
jgi:peptidoglycan/LPS O-acetylase OafA/YrhL